MRRDPPVCEVVAATSYTGVRVELWSGGDPSVRFVVRVRYEGGVTVAFQCAELGETWRTLEMLRLAFSPERGA